MFPILQVDTISINLPGMLLFLGLWIGITQSERYARKYNFETSVIFNLCLIGIAGGLVGARMVFALKYSAAFTTNLMSIISPNLLMLDFSGGLLGLFLASYIYGQRKKLPFFPSLDAVTPCLLIFSVALGFSNLSSGYAYGSPTSLPWGLPLWGALRHPTQIIEILFASLIAFLLWPENKFIQTNFFQKSGIRFFSFFVLAAFSRLILESLRGDTSFLIGSFRFPQIIAFLIMAISLILINIRLNQPVSALSDSQER
jgi:phosphatidylglycerol---prolipoprotein diacylglyceryl transferase